MKPGLLTSAAPFSAFGPSHQVVLVCAVGLAAALVWATRRHPGVGPVTCWTLGLAILLGEVAFVALPLFEGTWAARWSLPLQLCDLAALLALPALVTRRPGLVEPVVYWALTGTLLATLTPDLVRDAPHLEFWGFFASHALLVVAAVVMVWGVGSRPRAGSWRRVFLQVQVYGLGIAALNHGLGSNYLYLCRKPGVASPFDWLGPWPWYVVAADAIVLALFFGLSRVVEAEGCTVGDDA